MRQRELKNGLKENIENLVKKIGEHEYNMTMLAEVEIVTLIDTILEKSKELDLNTDALIKMREKLKKNHAPFNCELLKDVLTTLRNFIY